MKRDIKYSCQVVASEFTTLYGGESMDRPLNGGTYFWYVHNIPEKYNKYKTILAFERAFSIMQRAIDQIPPQGQWLNFEPTKERSKADFIISFGEGKHNIIKRDGTESPCPFLFEEDQKLGILAHVISIDKRGIHLDASEDWGAIMLNGGDLSLQDVFLHELGHAMNLAHSNDPSSFMYTPYTFDDRSISKVDMEVLEHVISPIKRLFYVDPKKPFVRPKLKDLYKCLKDAFLLWKTSRKLNPHG